MNQLTPSGGYARQPALPPLTHIEAALILERRWRKYNTGHHVRPGSARFDALTH